jgi:secreted trypsin-like serine protease
MLKKGLALLAVVVGVAAAAGAARAVEGGAPDAANAYAGVGLVVFYGSDGRPVMRCTGTLVSSTVLLTAAHCAGREGAGPAPVRAQVWFGNGYPTQIPRGAWNATNGEACEGVAAGYPCTGDIGGTPHPHPGWTGLLDLPNTRDIGVVVLDHPVSLPTYALAPAGTLDALAKRRGTQDTTFTLVGYGVQVESPGLEVAQRTRFVGDVKLTNLNSSLVDGYNVRVSASPGNGTGGSGMCTGDSGGPLFLDGQIAAVASFSVGKYCGGISGAFRTDTVEAQDFLAPYLR